MPADEPSPDGEHGSRADQRLKGTWRNLAGALRLAWAASPSDFVTMAGFAGVIAMLPAGVVWAGKQLVDAVATAQATGGGSFRSVLPTVLLLGALATAQQVLGTLQANRSEVWGGRVNHSAERRFMAKASTLDLEYFDQSQWHDRMARATWDIDWRPYQLANTVISLGAASVTVLGMSGLLASLDPVLVVLALASVLPSILVQRKVNRRIYEFHYTWTPDDRERMYLRTLLTEPQNTKEIRAFTLSRYLLDRHTAVTYRRIAELARLYRRASQVAVASSLIGAVSLTAAYAFMANGGVAGRLTPGELTAIIGAIASVSTQIATISQSFLQLDQHATFLQDFFAVLEAPPVLPVPDHPKHLPARLDGIEFDDVTFQYPTATERAVAGLSFRIEPGELVALVGDNGGGKTSLVKLLMRFYDPQHGAVRIGGVDLRDVDPSEVRARVGVLFQDFGRYELSARDNVVFGRPEREANDGEIEDVLAAARADAVVKTLRDGLDSKVGRLFEGGHDLSGGEWQRLALARLLFRDADIWILDEPTSALDPEAEAAIFAELRESLAGRMGIVISHRFSTVRIADRIAVISGGRVSESGTHEELLAAGGRYAELFEIQAAGYR